jgi:hypothetical protein
MLTIVRQYMHSTGMTAEHLMLVALALVDMLGT